MRSASICGNNQERIEMSSQPMHMMGRQAIASVLDESRFEFLFAPMIAWKSKLRPIAIIEKKRPTATSGRPQRFERLRVSWMGGDGGGVGGALPSGAQKARSGWTRS